MSRERCLAFMADLETRDLDKIARWFSECSVLWIPPREPVEGQRRILTLFRLIFRMYSDLHWQVEEVHAISNERFVYQTRSWGTIGTHMPYKNSILTLITFDAEGRIAFLSDYFKDTAIFACGRE